MLGYQAQARRLRLGGAFLFNIGAGHKNILS